MVLGPQVQSQPVGEQVLYQVDGDNVTVTTARFVVGGTMYPIRNITAVQLVRGEPSRALAWLIAMGIPLALWVMTTRGSELLGLILLGASGIGFFAAYLTAKGPLVVRVATSGGQVDAVTTDNEERAKAIVGALHHATIG